MIISSHKIFSNSIFSFNGDKLFYTLQERTDLQECMANLILKALHAKGTNFLGQYETNSSTKKQTQFIKPTNNLNAGVHSCRSLTPIIKTAYIFTKIKKYNIFFLDKLILKKKR